MKKVKFTAAAMCAVLVIGLLGGCGKEDRESGDLPAPEPGRYVETELELPAEWEEQTIKQIFMSEGKLHLLLEEKNGSLLQEWEKQEDGFVEVTGNWLSELVVPEGCTDLKLMQDESGIQYLFANCTEQEGYRGRLWRSDGEKALEITPQKWTILDEEWGYYEFINGIAVLNDGTLTANATRYLDTIAGGDGNVVDSEETLGSYGNEVLSDGESLYLLSADNTGAISAVEKRSGGKKNDGEIIPLVQNGAGMELCVTEEGTLYSAGSEGIFQRNPGESNWKKLISGSETDFSLSDRWCIGMAASVDGVIYALFQQSGGSCKLKKYEYDPDAVWEVKETLKLYAVEESFLLQNAVALYHRENPDVMIEVEYGYTYNDKYSDKELDYNDIYQRLNTLLMSDDAPDILVLDHLKLSSFSEKGLLIDIEDVVGPLEERGELLSGITGSYRQENGKRYVVPLQFAFAYITGRDISEDQMQSMESLAAFLDGKNQSYLGPQTVSELVDLFYPYFCVDIVNGKELNQEVLSEKLRALKIIGDNSGIVAQHDDSNGKNGHGYNMWDLASTIRLSITEGNGFNDCMFAIAITDYIKGEFTAFENSFQPLIQMGICTKSSYQDTARDFLRFVLSDAVQGTDYYSGFPVNAECLEIQAAADRTENSAETSIRTEDGGEINFRVEPYPQETAEKLLDLCRGLNKPVGEDAKIREVLTENLGEYLSGQGTLEDAVAKIEAGLKMYLAE